MGIRTKFNLVLLAVAALAFVLFAFVAAPIFQAEKKEEILEQARLLMESAQAIRDYTSEELRRSLIGFRMKSSILSRSLPMPPFITSGRFTRSIRNSPIGNLPSTRPIRRIARPIGKLTLSTISATILPRPSW